MMPAPRSLHLRSWAGALLALALPACAGSASDERTGTATASLLGGEETEGDDAVVAIVASDAVFCTGTLVGPQLVLTAAHCVEEAPRGVLEVAFGARALDGDGERVVVAAVALHPGYDRAAPGADLALLRLARRAPSHIEPAGIAAAGDPAPERGERVRHVGFGSADASTGAGMGVKRTAIHVVHDVSSEEIATGARAARTCFGDSGGPALRARAGGMEKVVGVVSRAAPGDHDCSGEITWDTRVDVNRDWLDARALAWGLRVGADEANEREAATAGADAGCTVAIGGARAQSFASAAPVLGALLAYCTRRRARRRYS